MHNRIFFVLAIALGVSLVSACGDDDGMGTPDTDGGTTDGGVRVDAATPITLAGAVFRENAPDRMAMPTARTCGAAAGAVETAGGRLVGARVVLKTIANEIISEAMTDDCGEYELMAPEDGLYFQQVEPIGDYFGSIRAEDTSDGVYDIVLQGKAGIDEVAMFAGIENDATRGWIATGFNPISLEAGGEGAMLEAGVAHDPAVVLIPGGVIQSSTFPPQCSTSMPPPDPCAPADRSNQIFWPNVAPGLVGVTAVSPAGGTCDVRFDVPEWLVEPGHLTIVQIDCMASM